MMRDAPATRAPCTTDWPIPPRPSTSTVAPGSTRAVLSTAPTPVCTAHPITHTDVERGVVGHLHRARLGGERVLGEPADAEAAVDRVAAAGQAGGAVEEGGCSTLRLFTHKPLSPRTHQ